MGGGGGHFLKCIVGMVFGGGFLWVGDKVCSCNGGEVGDVEVKGLSRRACLVVCRGNYVVEKKIDSSCLAFSVIAFHISGELLNFGS